MKNKLMGIACSIITGILVLLLTSSPAPATKRPRAYIFTEVYGIPKRVTNCWVVYDEHDKAVGGNCR
jgi:hypothetical protein